MNCITGQLNLFYFYFYPLSLSLSSSMPLTSSESFLNEQTKQCQSIQATAATISKTLTHQKLIRAQGTIPKRYRSKPLQIHGNHTINFYQSFEIHYAPSFFTYLDMIILHNTTQLANTETQLELYDVSMNQASAIIEESFLITFPLTIV